MKLASFPNWFEVKLTNGDQVARLLRQIPPKLQKFAMHKAISAGAGVVKRRAIADAPAQSGLLRKSLGVRRVRTRDRWTVSYRVQPRKGFKRPVMRGPGGARKIVGQKRGAKLVARNPASVEYRYPAMYAHFTELGHRLVKRGHVYGHVMGTHWMRLGLNQTRAAATRAIEGILRREIAKL